MIGTKKTCKFQVHRYRLLHKLPNFLEYITNNNDNSGLVMHVRHACGAMYHCKSKRNAGQCHYFQSTALIGYIKNFITNILKCNFADLRMKRQKSTIGAKKENKYGN